MRNLKVSLSLFALVLGMGTAFATANLHKKLNRTWGKESSGLYTEVTGQSYECSEGTQTCTAQFPADVNPNDQANDAHPGIVPESNIEQGVFSN
jgi:hypothetical protein